MAESSVSEHGFNLKDAEHERGTNRYVFPYPETWYNSQNFADLTVGLRSIILKPDPLQINLTGFQVVNIDKQALDPVLHINYTASNTVKDAHERPGINGVYLFADRMPIKVDMEVTEGITMKNICDKLNDEVNDCIKDYQDIYREQKEIYDSSTAESSDYLETFKINRGIVNFCYNNKREFIMETTQPSKFKFMATYNKYTIDVEHGPNDDLVPKKPEAIYPDEKYELDGFTDDFEMLLSIRLEEGLTLNDLLLGLAGKNREIPIPMAQELCDVYGITFEGVQTYTYTALPEYQRKEDGTYDINNETDPQTYVQTVLFTKLIVPQVWSRKDLLIKSSIAELDVNNYLGYSTMTTSSPVCIYASPKMYPIESQFFKFWIDLYDSYNDDLVELPDNVVMIIEAALYIQPKPQFNRY